MSELNWAITPAEFFGRVGWTVKKKRQWISPPRCPFCDGGSSGENYSLNVHEKDGNYFCHRTTCGERGSFWKLIESLGFDPREFLGERTYQGNRRKKKGYVYGKNVD